MERLFVAIGLPDYVNQALAALQEPTRGIRWSLPENYHLTLFFLGEVDPLHTPAIRAAIRQIQVHSFILPIGGVGHFPPRGQPSVLWAGIGSGHPHLFQLQHHLTDLLFNLGFDPGDRAWKPHITLARCSGVSPETVRQFEKRHAEFETAPARVDQFSLLSSERRGPRHFYSVVESFPLLSE
ncbi:RNA 2',3'-cyclic phosphodiesterase [Puniceicoccus vermicola]|uniref:RNA 2',3'-cyclic phosphodiesterase n=1 Tax=Puniceicoccus vermicola TaxID=388746 RepID=A0A7X1AXL8_9BACT|nr:RNA 2',3'-cyclic phosphodiesterase [Puniceicoccus vermicola]MBC2600690.1 RNA 2',3'-cyclic phosphodiesterase [Puniceicoccus vermicola]